MPSFLKQGSFGRAFEVALQQLLRWFVLAAPVLILRKMRGFSSVVGPGLDLDDGDLGRRS